MNKQLVALAVMGVAMFSAASASAEGKNGVAAVVNGKDITVATMKESYNHNPAIKAKVSFKDFYNKALDVFVDGELVYQAAVKDGVLDSKEYKTQLQMAKEELARKIYLEKKVDAKVTDAQLKKMYNEYKAKLKGEKEVKVGFITHGAPFYGTYLRDMVATQVICENYSNIQIESVASFVKIENAYRICRSMISEHPDIQALYVCWDQPALHVIRALEEMGREDIAVFTYDLDEQIGEYLVQERYVKGMGTQRPYEQGVAVGLATAKALLGSRKYKYVGVSPYTVQRYNFLKAWKEIMHEPVPEKLKVYFKE